MARKIVIVGEVFSSNMGDQAIHLGLKSAFLEAGAHVESLDLSGRQSLYSGRSGSSVFPLPFFYPALNFFRTILSVAKNSGRFLKKFREADLVIFGGGSLLIDNYYSFPLRLSLLGGLAKALGRKYVILGCSTRSMSAGVSSLLIDCFVSHASYVGLRDANSIRIMQSKGVSCSYFPDCAFLVKRRMISIREKYTAINVIGGQRHGYFSSIENISHYIELLHFVIDNCPGEIMLFTTGESSDEVMLRILIERLRCKGKKDVGIFIPQNLDNLYMFLEGARAVVGTRLHSVILARSIGVPVFSLAWDDKVQGFMESEEITGFSFWLKGKRDDVEGRIRISNFLKNPEQNTSRISLTQAKRIIEEVIQL